MKFKKKKNVAKKKAPCCPNCGCVHAGERGPNAKSQPETGKGNLMPTSKDDFAELRATIDAMAEFEARFDLARVIGRLVELGHVARANASSTPTTYRIVGFDSLDECDYLIGTIKDPVDAAVVELAVLGKLNFWPVTGPNPRAPDICFIIMPDPIGTKLTGRNLAYRGTGEPGRRVSNNIHMECLGALTGEGDKR